MPSDIGRSGKILLAAPTADGLRATESPFPVILNGLLQHGVIPGSSQTKARELVVKALLVSRALLVKIKRWSCLKADP
jgi:hypothetical protein